MDNAELKCLLVNPEDVTDPGNMDSILICLEKQRAEDEDFMELLVKKLRFASVTWEQPWYQQVNSLTRPVQSKEPQQEDYLKDAISKLEGDRIKKNWRKFIKKFDIPDTPICFVRWKNKDKSRNPRTAEEKARQFVTRYLARGLQRTPKQVYNYFQSHFGCPNKGHYTVTEENIMATCFYHTPSKAVTYLSSVLGRDPRGIYKKLHEANTGKAVKKRLKWNLPLASKFLKLLMKYSGLPLYDLKYRHIDKEIWLKLEQDFEQHHFYLQKFWYQKLHVQLFVKKRVKLKKLKFKILNILSSFPYSVWSDIRWKEVEKQMSGGFTKVFLYREIYRLISKLPKYYEKPFSELITEGHEQISHSKNKRLKTLTLNKLGELEEVGYSDKI